jgi:MFS family permease
VDLCRAVIRADARVLHDRRAVQVLGDVHGPAGMLGAFYTAFGLGAVIGALLTGYLGRWALWPTTIGIGIGCGAALLPLGLGASTPVALGSFAVAGLLWPPYSSMSTTLFQRSTTPALLSQVLAVSASVRILSVPLGTAFGGPLVATFSPAATLTFSAAAILTLGLAAACAMTLTTRPGPRRRKGQPASEDTTTKADR